MKKLIVFAFALTMAGAAAFAQEPVKKQQEPQKVEKCCGNHKKDANHKCTGECAKKKAAAEKKDAVKGQKVQKHECCGSKDANHKCSGNCKKHATEAKKVEAKKIETKK